MTEKKRNPRSWIIYGALAFLVLAIVASQVFGGMFNREEPTALTTDEFITKLKEDQIVDVTYIAQTAALNGSFLEPGETDKGNAKLFTSTWIGNDSFNEMMENSSANKNLEKWNVDASNPNGWLTTLLTVVLPIALIALFFFIMFSMFNSSNNKQMQFGKSKAKKAHEERPTVKFSDVAGIDEAVEELHEIKDFLTSPARYVQLGAKIPRGVLLVGPPGTGKTLLAKAVAGEAGVPFFSISGSDFVEMFVGVGASRVRDLFDEAKKSAPSIIFIDEIDAVGRQRGAGLGGGHDEREQTLNQLLVEMDGFEDNQSVILIAATNRVDILDPALLRPGRFDRQIVVMRPDLKGREQILKVHSEGKPLAHSVSLHTLAKMTPGFTGADLANLMNEAALLTARKDKKLITMNELNEAMEREIAGPERKSRVMTEKEKRTIAYHEAGHAVVGHVLEHSDPVHKVSIISRGQALGYTLSLPEEDKFLSTRNEMYDNLAVFMGGRVAEEIFCDDVTTGASNDLERATKMARQMVTRYGMTEALGTQVYGEANHEVFLGRDYGATPDYSEATAQRIDEEVARIMTKAHTIATDILKERKAQMDLMVGVLMERETIEGLALDALLGETWDDYLEHEEEILAKKAEDERKQIEEDERHAAEAKRVAEEQAKQQALAPGVAAMQFGDGGRPGIGSAQPGAQLGVQSHPDLQLGAGSAARPSAQSQSTGMAKPHTNNTAQPTLDDVFAGRADLDEFVQKRLGAESRIRVERDGGSADGVGVNKPGGVGGQNPANPSGGIGRQNPADIPANANKQNSGDEQ